MGMRRKSPIAVQEIVALLLLSVEGGRFWHATFSASRQTSGTLLGAPSRTGYLLNRNSGARSSLVWTSDVIVIRCHMAMRLNNKLDPPNIWKLVP